MKKPVLVKFGANQYDEGWVPAVEIDGTFQELNGKYFATGEEAGEFAKQWLLKRGHLGSDSHWMTPEECEAYERDSKRYN